MTKKQELQVLDIIIQDGKIKGGSYDSFWFEYKGKFTFTQEELVPILNKYYNAGDVDEEFVVTEQLSPKHKALKQEVEAEDARQMVADVHLGNQAELTARQKRFFWVPIIISFAALLVAFFKPTPKYDDTELREYIKTHTDSAKSEIQKDIDSTKIKILDQIYSDTTIINIQQKISTGG